MSLKRKPTEEIVKAAALSDKPVFSLFQKRPPAIPITWRIEESTLIIGEFLKEEQHTGTGGSGNAPLSSSSSPSSSSSLKLACFDLDNTITTTASGNTFHKSATDYKFVSARVPERLKQLHQQGYSIVIFSNQNGILEKKDRLAVWKERVRNILNELRIPLTLLAASGKDHFRKPRIGMWDHYRVKLIPPELTASNNHEDSFYVGDAAGRPNNWKSKAKKDFSDSDLKFALNIPLKFHTPESFWDGESVPSFMPTFQPRLFLMETSKKPPILFAPTHRPLVSSSQEIIIFVGFPASGKSAFAEKHLIPHGYIHVNQDTLKTKEKCIKACEESVKMGKSVVIDNTNPNRDTRASYIRIANEHSIQARCFHFVASREICNHNNHFRSETGDRKRLPDIAFNSFSSRFEEPCAETEGLVEVKQISFVPSFENEEMKEQWAKFFV